MKRCYADKSQIMVNNDIYNKWYDFINDPKYCYNFLDKTGKWNYLLNKVKKYINDFNKKPIYNSKNKDKYQNILGKWLSHQITNYKYKKDIMSDTTIRDTWTQFINDPKYAHYFSNSKQKPKKDMSLKIKPEIKPKSDNPSSTNRKPPPKSELSKLHQLYKTMNSNNLHQLFKTYPNDWKRYHEISKQNETSFPEEEIPRNLVIQYLENIPGSRQKTIVDLGCGYAEVHNHFRDNPRFKFYNFDHHACNDNVIERDIRDTRLNDYSVDVAILSLAMWGSNCRDYLTEVYRILDTGGTLLIVEAYKRWYDEELGENKLEKLLIEKGFNVIEKRENKFMFMEVRK
jgi:hypothetical protein